MSLFAETALSVLIVNAFAVLLFAPTTCLLFLLHDRRVDETRPAPAPRVTLRAKPPDAPDKGGGVDRPMKATPQRTGSASVDRDQGLDGEKS